MFSLQMILSDSYYFLNNFEYIKGKYISRLKGICLGGIFRELHMGVMAITNIKYKYKYKYETLLFLR